MNSLAFEDGEQGRNFDANFISTYNKDKKQFEYFVQRLIGQEIQDEKRPGYGKIWVPYINAKREDWSYLCENNRIVSRQDEILFRFEEGFQQANTNN